MPRAQFGVGRTLDLSANFDMYNFSMNDKETDARALYMDWLAVADDLTIAIGDYALQQHSTSTCNTNHLKGKEIL